MSKQREIQVNGHKIVAIEFNKEKGGTPVVFVHGITASINYWEPLQVPIIKDKYHWYSLSLPGHYPATLPSGFNNKDMTADMVGHILMGAIRELVGDQSFILAGHSTGGFAALQIAANFPKNIVGVLCISGFARGKWTGTLGLLQFFARAGMIGRAIFRTNIKILAASRFVYNIAAGFYTKDRKAFYSYPGFKSILDIVHRDTKELNPASLIPYFNRLPDIDISKALPKISAPTLVLAGKNDPVMPHDQPPLIADKVPNSELSLIEGCGHLPMFERPDEYNRIITEWLQKIGK